MKQVGLLAVHGFGGTPCEVSEVTTIARQRGWEVTSPLLPGHGASADELATVDFTQWIKTVEKSFNELLARVEQVGLIGLSMGGLLVLHLAGSLLDSRVPVCVISTPHRIVPFYMRPLVKLLGKLRVNVRPKGRDVEGSREQVLDCPSLSSIPLAVVNQLIHLRDAVVSRLNVVRNPVLIVHSKKDALVPPSDARMLFNRIGSPRKKLIILEQGGHNLLKDFNRKEVVSLVLNWMARQMGL